MASCKKYSKRIRTTETEPAVRTVLGDSRKKDRFATLQSRFRTCTKSSEKQRKNPTFVSSETHAFIVLKFSIFCIDRKKYSKVKPNLTTTGCLRGYVNTINNKRNVKHYMFVIHLIITRTELV